MSDDELDREWKPNARRPQSTMARSFSLALNDLFKIDNSLADLDAAVSEKKQKVSSQTSELEALEARLKAAEDRLRAAGIAPSSPPAGGNGRSSPSSNGKASPRARPAIGQDTFSPTRGEHGPTSPLATEFKSASRPQTKDGRPQTKDGRAVEGSTMPGASPPTPGASEGEFSSDPETSDKEFVVVKNDRVVQELPANLDEDGDEVVSPTEQN